LLKDPPARWLQPAGYERMFTAAAQLNQAISCLIDPDSLPELDRMCHKHPETPVIIDHLCRIGVDGQIREAAVAALCAMAEHKRVLVKVGAFYALGKKRAPYTDLGPMIQKVVKAFGANRCMWESDCPFQVVNGHKYQDSVDLIRVHLDFLTADQREALLWRTAENFFFKNKKVGA
jgi:predicted TIM-barrel fold metal-dependent hydrolase